MKMVSASSPTSRLRRSVIAWEAESTMYRLFFYLSWITLLILTAFGVRFIPFGEVLQTEAVTKLQPVIETPLLPVEISGEAVGVTLQPTASPAFTVSVAQPTPVEAVPEAVPLASDRKVYQLQPGSPAWLPNFIHPDAGCNWLGAAGQAFDAEGNPVTMLVVEVGGTLSRNQVQSLSLTGVAPAYGPSGYEVHLGNRALDSSSTLWVLLKDLSGKELTDRIYFDTYSDCTRNLVLINFIESRFEIEVVEYFIPVFYNGVVGSSRGLSVDGDSGGDTELEFFIPLFYNRYLPESTSIPTP